jgi:hypothetical protein
MEAFSQSDFLPKSQRPSAKAIPTLLGSASSEVNLRIITLMMVAEMVSETLGFYPQMARRFAGEDFIN